MPPSSCMQLQKSCAVGLASLGVMRRAHKVDQLMHELEVLEFPTGVRALKDYDRGELTIGWPSASPLPGPTPKSSPIGRNTVHLQFDRTHVFFPDSHTTVWAQTSHQGVRVQPLRSVSPG